METCLKCTHSDPNNDRSCCLVNTFHESRDDELAMFNSISKCYYSVWEDLVFKNPGEMHTFLMSVVQRCCAESKGEKRAAIDWKVFCRSSNVDVIDHVFVLHTTLHHTVCKRCVNLRNHPLPLQAQERRHHNEGIQRKRW